MTPFQIGQEVRTSGGALVTVVGVHEQWITASFNNRKPTVYEEGDLHAIPKLTVTEAICNLLAEARQPAERKPVSGNPTAIPSRFNVPIDDLRRAFEAETAKVDPLRKAARDLIVHYRQLLAKNPCTVPATLDGKIDDLVKALGGDPTILRECTKEDLEGWSDANLEAEFRRRFGHRPNRDEPRSIIIHMILDDAHVNNTPVRK